MARLNLFSAEEERTLFPLRPNFRIVEIGATDAAGCSDNFKILKELVAANQSMYPDIERWFDAKVVPGLLSTQRVGYVAYEDQKPIASGILKIGDRSKFCHLRIHKDFQDLDLGQVFFTQMTLEIRHIAKEIHFTLPESLWYEKRDFFESFGFTEVITAPRQYRHGEAEFMCSAPLSKVWSAAVDKLPSLMTKFSVGGFSLQNKLLISVKPMYVEKILAGIKSVEIRRKFSRKWVGCRVALYASAPLGALVGEASIRSVSCGQPDEIWAHFGTRIGCTREQLDKYTGSADQIYAIELANVLPYHAPLYMNQVEHLLGGDLRPPQSYCQLHPEKTRSWAQAVTIASFLHGRSRSIMKHPFPAIR